ncbi:hypothetical protein [Natronolimnohabitans innermongolicus]|uniref:Uncharacterized protein n=1 Tax=Natronolimnohabitans innermongolicus JCM 12255 TaxID=1227499 RepID=L9XA58_9EURY|nr:hypothetical protein [Natronolimnohabitans innermongolicus]ELY58336.1 hypothetical protein C493_07164 [Natronolimnohabitans innermongolicus JCM 12255]
MSDNVIQSIEKVLSQQDNGLTQDEIEMICDRFSQKANPAKFRRALTDDIDGKDARASLEGMMMFWTGDAELAAKVVVGSETTSENTELEAAKAEIRHRDQHWGKDGNGWNRYEADRTDDDSNGPDSDNATNSNQEYTPQRRRSNRVSNPSQLDPDAESKRRIRKDLFGK